MADELQPLLGELHLNDTFSRADVQNVESLIKDKLGERGYGSATVNTVPTFDDANKTLALTFVVDAGRRYLFVKFALKVIRFLQIAHCVKKCVSKKGLGITHN